MKKKACKECGGPTVRGLDRDRTCPSCQQLRDFSDDMKMGTAKDDQHHLGDENYRRYANAG